MPTQSEMENILRNILPRDLHREIPELTGHILTLYQQRDIFKGKTPVVLTSPSVARTFDALPNTPLRIGNSQVSFDGDSQTGDVTINDVVGGDVFRFTIIPSSTQYSGASVFPVLALTIVSVLAATIGLLLGFWLSRQGAVMPETRIYDNIPPISAANEEFLQTGVFVKKGDIVEIKVPGVDPFWSCDAQLDRVPKTSAEGLFGYRSDKFVVPSANICELVGYINNRNSGFRVGAFERFVAPVSGEIALGANDEIGHYADNSGELIIEIVLINN